MSTRVGLWIGSTMSFVAIISDRFKTRGRVASRVDMRQRPLGDPPFIGPFEALHIRARGPRQSAIWAPLGVFGDEMIDCIRDIHLIFCGTPGAAKGALEECFKKYRPDGHDLSLKILGNTKDKMILNKGMTPFFPFACIYQVPGWFSVKAIVPIAFYVLISGLALSAQTGTNLAPRPSTSYYDLFRSSAVTLVSENDKYFAGTDHHYTNGLKLSFLGTTRLNESPEFIRRITKLIPSLGYDASRESYKVGVSLGQNLYTPTDTEALTPDPRDRPYAAWLYASLDLQAKSADGEILRTVGIAVGMVGPAALGRQAQNGFHTLVGVPHSNGWDHQLHNEPGLMLTWENRHRLLRVGTRSSGFATDLIGRYGFSVGNIRTNALAGFGVRVGWHLPEDFGADIIRPSGGDETPARTASIYVFASTQLQGVVRNIFLDGNTLRDSPSVRKRPFVGDFAVGIVARVPMTLGSIRGLQLAYTQNFRTKEFYGQSQRDVFGSFSLSVLF